MKMSPLPTAGRHFLSCAKPSEWCSILEVVEDTSNKALLDCIDGLLDDVHLLSVAASHSHRHQLGFIKLVLKADSQGRCLRLHFWDKGSSVEEDIHSHCAHFQSRVVIGSLTENSFELTAGTTHSRFRYYFDVNVGRSVATTEGLTDVRLSGTRTLRQGHSYHKLANELHNVTQAAKGTITISAWDSRDSLAMVLKAKGASAEDCSTQIGMSPIELREELIRIRERMPSK